MSLRNPLDSQTVLKLAPDLQIASRADGLTIAQTAKQLNKEGYRTPRSRQGYTATSVRKLLSRQRQKADRTGKSTRPKKAGRGTRGN